MTGKEMFEALGYSRVIWMSVNSKINYIRYYKDENNVYHFNPENNTFCKRGEYDSYCDDITMEELKAINQQMKELGCIE